MIVEISMSHINQYFEDAIKILKKVDKSQVEKIIQTELSARLRLLK